MSDEESAQPAQSKRRKKGSGRAHHFTRKAHKRQHAPVLVQSDPGSDGPAIQALERDADAERLTRAFSADAADQQFADYLQDTPSSDQPDSFVNVDASRQLDGWFIAGEGPIAELTDWFDQQYHDYNIKEHYPLQAVRQVWLADAVDNVFDITSRPFILFFSSEIGPDRIERLKQNKQIVFRTRLTCNDACSKGSAWNRAEIKNDRKEEREDHQAHCTKCINTARGKKTSCSWLLAHQKAQRKKTCSVQLIVEVNASDLSRYTVWQSHAHIRARSHTKHLRLSPNFRRQILLKASTFATRASHIMKSFREMGGSHRDRKIPDFRWPTQKQVENIVENLRSRHYMDKDPLIACEKIAENLAGYDGVFWFQPHDPQAKYSDSPLAMGMTRRSGLLSLIRHYHRMHNFDSVYRNLNDARAPVSWLTVTNSANHAIPGAALLSANVRTGTLESFFIQLRSSVEQLATEIAKNNDLIDSIEGSHRQVQRNQNADDFEADRARIIKNAKLISEQGWQGQRFMIDKHRPSKDAIEKVLGASVSICAPHCFRAILRWQGNGGERIPDAERRWHIPTGLKVEILRAFKRYQRGRFIPGEDGSPNDSESYWKRKEDDFDAAIQQAVKRHFPARGVPSKQMRGSAKAPIRTQGAQKASKNGKSSKSRQGYSDIERRRIVDQIMAYFRKYWFCDYWRTAVTDDSLPPFTTRDGNQNTNNHVEAFILSFMRKFMGLVKARRIDHVPWIILNDVFYHYAYFEEQDPRIYKADKDILSDGYTLWMHDAVSSVRDRPDVFLVRLITPNADTTVSDTGLKQHRVKLGPAPKCPCDSFQATGKLCSCLWAARLYDDFGPFANYEENLSRRREHTSRPSNFDMQRGKRLSDRKTNALIRGGLASDEDNYDDDGSTSALSSSCEDESDAVSRSSQSSTSSGSEGQKFAKIKVDPLCKKSDVEDVEDVESAKGALQSTVEPAKRKRDGKKGPLFQMIDDPLQPNRKRVRKDLEDQQETTYERRLHHDAILSAQRAAAQSNSPSSPPTKTLPTKALSFRRPTKASQKSNAPNAIRAPIGDKPQVEQPRMSATHLASCLNNLSIALSAGIGFVSSQDGDWMALLKEALHSAKWGSIKASEGKTEAVSLLRIAKASTQTSMDKILSHQGLLHAVEASKIDCPTSAIYFISPLNAEHWVLHEHILGAPDWEDACQCVAYLPYAQPTDSTDPLHSVTHNRDSLTIQRQLMVLFDPSFHSKKKGLGDRDWRCNARLRFLNLSYPASNPLSSLNKVALFALSRLFGSELEVPTDLVLKLSPNLDNLPFRLQLAGLPTLDLHYKILAALVSGFDDDASNAQLEAAADTLSLVPGWTPLIDNAFALQTQDLDLQVQKILENHNCQSAAEGYLIQQEQTNRSRSIAAILPGFMLHGDSIVTIPWESNSCAFDFLIDAIRTASIRESMRAMMHSLPSSSILKRLAVLFDALDAIGSMYTTTTSSSDARANIETYKLEAKRLRNAFVRSLVGTGSSRYGRNTSATEWLLHYGLADFIATTPNLPPALYKTFFCGVVQIDVCVADHFRVYNRLVCQTRWDLRTENTEFLKNLPLAERMESFRLALTDSMSPYGHCLERPCWHSEGNRKTEAEQQQPRACNARSYQTEIAFPPEILFFSMEDFMTLEMGVPDSFSFQASIDDNSIMTYDLLASYRQTAATGVHFNGYIQVIESRQWYKVDSYSTSGIWTPAARETALRPAKNQLMLIYRLREGYDGAQRMHQLRLQDLKSRYGLVVSENFVQKREKASTDWETGDRPGFPVEIPGLQREEKRGPDQFYWLTSASARSQARRYIEILPEFFPSIRAKAIAAGVLSMQNNSTLSQAK